MSDSDELKRMAERAMTAEAELEDLRAQSTKLEQELEEEEEKLRQALLELDKHKEHQQQITRLEEELKQARDAAASQPPPPPPPDTFRLEEQLKSKEGEIGRLNRKLEALDHLGAERDELAKEVDDLRAQNVHLKDKLEFGAGEAVEHLKTELEEMTKKQAASVDTARKLTQENQQLLEKLATMKREHDELIKKAEEVRNEISIVSRAQADGTQPETAVPPEVVPSGEPAGTPDTTPETVPAGTVPTRPSGGPIREVLPQKEPPQDVVVDKPESPPPEEVLESTLEDSLLAELEPLPMPAVSAPPEPPSGVSQPSPSSALSVPGSLSEGAALSVPGELAPSPSKGGWFLKVFLFLILIGGVFLAVQHFLPRFLYPPAAEQPPAEVVVPEPPPPEIPAEPAPEKPVEKVVEKKSRTEKRKPKETAKARKPKKTVKAGEPEMTVSEIKRQIRRLISSKQLDEAQKLLVEWVKKHPKEAGLRYLYGRLYLLSGKKNDAVDQLEEAIGLAPKMASAYHDLGAVYLQLGDNESACEALGHFVRLKPDHPRTPAVQDLMKKIKCP